MLENFIDFILKPVFDGSGWLHFVSLVVAFIVIFAVAMVAYYITKFVVSVIASKLVNTDRSGFLRIVSKNKTLALLAHIAAGGVVWSSSQFITQHDNLYSVYEALVLSKLSLFYILITCLFIAGRLVWSLNTYYERKFDFARQYPIYSYLKVAILFIWVIGIVLIVSFFMNTSPWALLTGVGAVSAVFLLVFKDTLLGIVSSIQATALNIVRIGDRISLDKYGVDGRVLDISINMVKVQNSDNTTASIPTYMLTSEIVKNWRYMEELGIKRIKRSVYLDTETIIVCDATLLESLKKLPVLKKYIEDNHGVEIINLSIFRMYFQYYLDKHAQISHNDLTLVRHLDPTPAGLPLEVYAFANTVILADYEQIQADIFEHLFSMLPFFSLKVFKSSSS